MAREVTIVDAGLGNLASVERALIQVGAAVRVSGDPDKVATSRMVVFPGQGAFGAATQAIVDGALGAAVRMVIDRGDPFLGICLGMQLLFDGSDENGGQPGLAILPGHCRHFPMGIDEEAEPGASAPSTPIRAVDPHEGPSQRETMVETIAAALESDAERPATSAFSAADAEDSNGNREDGPPGVQQAVGASSAIIPVVPEIIVPDIPPAANAGWTPPIVAPVVAPVPEPLPVSTEPLRRRVKVPHVGWNEVEPTGEHYYFVHSYYVDAARSEDVMWVTSYGGLRFPAAVRYQNVLGCQFHPEKSQRSGLKFLRAFLLGGLGVIIIPAIDLQGGRAVRLAQGDRARATVYDVEPLQLVESFAAAGVTMMHVVDLDGAFAGASTQLERITGIVERAHTCGMEIQVGGGLRDADAVARALACGADRAVVGTLAIRDPELAAELCARHAERIVVAADAREGKVAVDGWRERSELSAIDLVRAAERWGAAAVLYTDVARDGTQHGPAVDATRTLQSAVAIPVLASGGVGTLADLDACREAGIRGVIVGRALYERSFSIEEAVSRC